MKKILTILLLMLTVSTFGATCTWSSSGWDSAPNTNGNDNVIIVSNYNGASFICKDLTVNNGVTVRVINGNYIEVTNHFTLNAGSTFIVEDGGSLINMGSQTINGTFTLKRNTKPVKLNDYTFWSSPVANQNYLALPPFGSLRVFSFDNDNWVREWGGTMTAGKGYIAHRPIVYDPNGYNTYTMNFTGVPNIGELTVQSTGDLHLLGNPYTSSLDLDKFIRVNETGAVYLWTHNTTISSAIDGDWAYNYTNDDYAIFNLVGGLPATSAADVSPDDPDSSNDNRSIPTQYIGSGQGFMVSTTTTGLETFVFKEVMRPSGTIANNSQFFRQNNDEGRIWLSLTNNKDITRYALIGYINGATNEYDYQYDATKLEGGPASVYSILANKKLAIQGRGEFDKKDKIQLGYKLPKAGAYEIDLYNVDGRFDQTSEPIWLEDKLLGITHNLKDGKYSFTATSGTVENRFVLKFNNNNSAHDKAVELESTSLVYTQDKNVVVTNSTENITDIVVYDTLGRVVYTNNNVGANTLTINNLPQGVLIFKISVNGVTVTKKHLKN